MNTSNNIDRLLDHIEGMANRAHIALPSVPIEDFVRLITYWREQPIGSYAVTSRSFLADMRGLIAELNSQIRQAIE